MPRVEVHRQLDNALTFLARIQVKQRENYTQQHNLPECEDCLIKPSCLVMCVHENYEGAERDANYEPDDLSFRVPHRCVNFVL